MNKKTYRISIIVCAVVFVIGLILTINNETPYTVCRMWLAEGPSGDCYSYATQHIRLYTTLYFGGMVLMAGGAVIGVILTVGRCLKAKEKPVKKEINQLID